LVCKRGNYRFEMTIIIAANTTDSKSEQQENSSGNARLEKHSGEGGQIQTGYRISRSAKSSCTASQPMSAISSARVFCGTALRASAFSSSRQLVETVCCCLFHGGLL
jgi:hypothetical protein